jgi:ABC-type antimicrobial peptide transport system permease subunit
MAAIGLVVGLAAAFALTRVMRGLVFEVSTTDPATFVAAAGLLASLAVGASYWPARRAAQIDPTVALRSE